MLNADEVAVGNPRRKGTSEQACSTGGCYVLFTGNSTRIVSEENGQPVAEDGRFLVFSASDRLIGGLRHMKRMARVEAGMIEAPDKQRCCTTG
jgi:hypothetical protein